MANLALFCTAVTAGRGCPRMDTRSDPRRPKEIGLRLNRLLGSSWLAIEVREDGLWCNAGAVLVLAWLVLLLVACRPSGTAAATGPGASLRAVTAACDGCTCPASQTTHSGEFACGHFHPCCVLSVGPRRVTASSAGTPSGGQQSHASWRRVEPPLRSPIFLAA